MGKAARAIIIEDNKILAMYRNKEGSEYYTLVGGRVHEDESLQQALVREVKEETGLDVVAATLMFVEPHPEPYNEQYVYFCNIGPHDDIVIQDSSEEGFLNKLGANIHQPFWIDSEAFAKLAFRTPQLQSAIVTAIKNGFPTEPVML